MHVRRCATYPGQQLCNGMHSHMHAACAYVDLTAPPSPCVREGRRFKAGLSSAIRGIHTRDVRMVSPFGMPHPRMLAWAGGPRRETAALTFLRGRNGGAPGNAVRRAARRTAEAATARRLAARAGRHPVRRGGALRFVHCRPGTTALSPGGPWVVGYTGSCPRTHPDSILLLAGGWISQSGVFGLRCLRPGAVWTHEPMITVARGLCMWLHVPLGVSSPLVTVDHCSGGVLR